jgi:hypothetical protein
MFVVDTDSNSVINIIKLLQLKALQLHKCILLAEATSSKFQRSKLLETNMQKLSQAKRQSEPPDAHRMPT